MTKKLVSESGVDYEINCADFSNALLMKNAVLKCIQKSDIQKEQIDSLTLLLIGNKGKKDGTKLNEKDILGSLKQKNMHFESLLNGIKNTFIELDTSSDIYEILWKCLSRCTYNGERITQSIFENPEARADFYEVAFACILENIQPFFKSLTSMFANLGSKMNQNIQEFCLKLG